MSEEDLIIVTYCLAEELYETRFRKIKLRHRGPAPSLTDVEVLTLLIVGEYLGLGSDKQIWAYFKRHWQNWFPGLGCRTSFTRQSANLLAVMDQLQQVLSERICGNTDFSLMVFPFQYVTLNVISVLAPFVGLVLLVIVQQKTKNTLGLKDTF